MIAIRYGLAYLAAGLLFVLSPAWATKPASAGVSEDELDTGIAPIELPRVGERILSYASDITVNRDSRLSVVETIRVRAEGNQIRRGIFRDFPTRYQREGRTVRIGFDVQGVTRNGQAEPYSTERIDNGVRIRVGSEDVMLAVGEHLYEIRYRTTRQIGFLDNYDELYWNVTGTGWAFPIDRAEATIRLPQAVQFGNRAVYTGAQGADDHNAQVVSERPGEISFRTTAPLGPYEGLTVAVAWPKGVVEQPPPPSAAETWLAENGPMGAAIAALAALAGFFYYAWKRAGRGPDAGTVVPLFEPPEDMSPAAVRYVKEMGFDNRVYAAALIDGAVRGKLRLVETEGGWFSSDKMRIERTGDPSDLPVEERNMLNSLFAGGSSIEMDRKNHVMFRAAQTSLQGALDSQYKGKLFLGNLHWAFVGLLLVPAAMLFVGGAILAFDPYREGWLWLIPWAGAGAILLGIHLLRVARHMKSGGWLPTLGAWVLFIGALTVLFLTFGLAGELDGPGWIFAPLLGLPLVISAFWWMSAPTRKGRAVMDRIAGFEHYLSITEEERLEALHPPEKTPELFERYLPYAIALDVENSWAHRFSGVLAAAAADPSRQGHHFGWYSGSSSPWNDVGGFTAAIGGTLASSVASASTAPGSSSGSGGGGFSGGGGGGGGGGGW